MVKIKEKKWKAKNFRQLSNEIIRDPMVYLTEFFGGAASAEEWLREINLTVNSAVCPEMACADVLQNGFHCQQLILQVEVAYLLYKKAGLKRQAAPLAFFRLHADYVAYSDRGAYTQGGGVDPADTLSRFFSFQSLRAWYTALDELMRFLTCPKLPDDGWPADRALAVRELLLRLGQAMYVIYERGGSLTVVPSDSAATVR